MIGLTPIFDHCQKHSLDPIQFIHEEYWGKEKTLLGMAKEWGVVRITLTKFMDRHGIPRRSLSETQLMVATNPSRRQATQRKRWREAGQAQVASPDGRQAGRQRCTRNNPAKSPGARAKISAAKMGEGNWMYGRYGPLNPAWRGGHYRYSPGFERIRRAILERDNHTCRLCEEPGNNVHHIDYNRSNNDPLNLITLCHHCHMGTNNGDQNRAKWQEFFVRMMTQQLA